MAQDKYSQNRQLAYDLLKQEGYTDIGDSAEELFKNKANAELAYKLLTDAGYTDLGADYNEFSGMLYAPEQAAPATQPSSRPAPGTEQPARTVDTQAAAEGRSLFNQMTAARRGTSSLSDAPQATQQYMEQNPVQGGRREMSREELVERLATVGGVNQPIIDEYEARWADYQRDIDNELGGPEVDAKKKWLDEHNAEYRAAQKAIGEIEGKINLMDQPKNLEAIAAKKAENQKHIVPKAFSTTGTGYFPSQGQHYDMKESAFYEAANNILDQTAQTYKQGSKYDPGYKGDWLEQTWTAARQFVEGGVNNFDMGSLTFGLTEGSSMLIARRAGDKSNKIVNDTLNKLGYKDEQVNSLLNSVNEKGKNLSDMSDVIREESAALESMKATMDSWKGSQAELQAYTAEYNRRAREYNRSLQNYNTALTDYEKDAKQYESIMSAVGAAVESGLSDGEKAVLDALQDFTTAKMRRAKDVSIASAAGAGAEQSAEFMLDFILTGGLEKASTKLVSKWLLKDATKELGFGGKVLADVISSAGRTAVMMPRNLAAYGENLVQMTGGVDNLGRYQFDRTHLNAALNTALNQYIEYWSEGFGEYFAAGERAAFKRITGSAPRTTIGKTLSQYRGNIGQYLDHGKFNGMFNEMLEEVVGAHLDALAGWTSGGRVGDKKAIKNFYSGEQMATLALSFLPMSAISAGTNIRAYNKMKERYDNAVATLNPFLNSDKITREELDELVSNIADKTPQEITAKIVEITDNARKKNGGYLPNNFAQSLMGYVEGTFAMSLNNETWENSQEKMGVVNAYTEQYANPDERNAYDLAQLESEARAAAESVGFDENMLDLDPYSIARHAQALQQSNPAQAQVLLGYAAAKSAKMGLKDGYDAETTEYAKRMSDAIEQKCDINGNIIRATLADGSQVFITSKDASVGADGKLNTPTGADGLVSYIAPDGRELQAKASAFTGATAQDTTLFLIESEDSFKQSRDLIFERAQNTISPAGKARALNANIGNTVFFRMNGIYEPMQVDRITQDGTHVVVSGDAKFLNGLATMLGLQSPGGKSMELPIDTIWPMLATNDDGSLATNQPEAEVAQPTATPAQPATAPAQPASEPEVVNPIPTPEYSIGEDTEVILDGNRRTVTILDVSDGKVYYEFEDENGDTQTRYLPYNDFMNAQDAAANPRATGTTATSETPATPAEQPQAPAVEETSAEEAPQSKIPVDKDGNKIYDAPGVEPIDAYDDMYSTPGLTEEDVDEWVIAQSDEAEKNRNPKIKKGQSLADWGKEKAEANRKADFWKELREVAEEHAKDRKEQAQREAELQKEIEKYGVDTRGFDLTPQTVEEAVAEYLGNNEGIIDLDDAKKEIFGKSGRIPSELFRHAGNGGILTKKGGRTIADVANDIVGEFEGQLPIEQDAVRDLIIDYLARYTKTEMRDMIFNNRLNAALAELEQQNGASSETETAEEVEDIPAAEEQTPAEEAVEEAPEGTAVPEVEDIPEVPAVEQQIKQARQEVDTNPTDAQKEAGNYKKGHIQIDGYDVTIENPKGSVRSGKDANGNEWSVTMNNDYGYIRGTEGVDGDHIDMFLSDHPGEGKVFVVDQVNEDGTFDEHKVMYGFNSEQEAMEAYLANYSPGWKGLGNITEVSKEEFKKWIDSSHRKTKPFAEYSSVKTSETPGNSVPSQEEGGFQRPVFTLRNSTDQAQARNNFVEAVGRRLIFALRNGTEKPYKSITDLRKEARAWGLEVEDSGATDILLQELVELALVKAARAITEQNGIKSKNAFDQICRLYELQPTIGRRSSERVAMQQYSTPLPMSFVAQMFAYNGEMKEVLEPTAGNGMLVFGIPGEKVHANELDDTRNANLQALGFGLVSKQDATEPFGGKYDAVIANPPFGSHDAVEFDGKQISGLDPIITLRALDAMKDGGKAAIIIGGNVEFADNGAWKTKKAFFSYLYDHYNVKGVVNMAGDLYAKQGTTYPTMMILIDGRRSEEERAAGKVYPPTSENARPMATTQDELYDIVKEILNDNRKTDGNQVLRSEERAGNTANNSGQAGNLFPADSSNESSSDGADGQRGRNDSRAVVQDADGNSVSGANEENPRVRVANEGERPGSEVDARPGAVSGPGGRNGSSGASVPGTDGAAGTDGRGNQPVRDGNARGIPAESVSGRERGSGVLGLENKPKEQKEKRKVEDKNLPYVQHSSAKSLESVAPASMVEAMDAAIQQIEKENGKTIDEWMVEELGYKDTKELYNALAAEQIDSVAMAIYQMKKGKAMIIGDQTGVGKGRQMAALIRWASLHGKKPIFMTQKAGLFSDIYRDMKAVGSAKLKPLIINAVQKERDKDTGEMKHGDRSGVMLEEDKNGKLVEVYLSPGSKKLNEIIASGKVPAEYDYVVLTYSQLNNGDEQSRQESHNNKPISAKDTAKARYIRSIAADGILLMDESHTAAGEDSNSGAFLQSIMPSVNGVTFASATFAKRASTMPLYAIKSAMSEANVEPKELIDMIKRGGVTLQELMARALTGSGQMVRRERDMSDVKTDWKTIDDPATAKRARENYDRAVKIFNDIIAFQQKYIVPFVQEEGLRVAASMGTTDITSGTENFGVDNPPFVNQTYNFTKQLMLALKVDAIVNEVVNEIKAGRHPVIALENTYESGLDGYNVGDNIEDTSFSAGLLRSLAHIMQYTYTDEDGIKHQEQFSPKDLGAAGEQAYYALQEQIREATKDIFLSPLDGIREKLQEQGYKVGEITGRKTQVVKGEDGYTLQKRTADAKQAVVDFNNGTLDVIIINKSGSTGISLHSSVAFKDQRQRSMIIAQPLGDINDYMQMIGRIDRTGQVHRGYYINLSLPVPAELRFNMMLATKLKSLNANTTTDQEGNAGSVEAPDFLNKYGSQVVIEYLRDHPEVFEKLLDKDFKLGGKNSRVTTAEDLESYVPGEDDAQRVTGRIALLPVAEQEAFYNEIAERYNALIKYLDETGENTLKISTLPLRAKTLARKVGTEGRDPNGSNPFAQNSYVERVEVDVLKKPMKADEIRKVRESLSGGKEESARVRELLDRVEEQRKQRIAAENERYERKKEKTQKDIDRQAAAIRARNVPEADAKVEIKRVTDRLTSEINDEHTRNLAAIESQHNLLRDRFEQFNFSQTYLIHETIVGDNLFEGAGSPSLFLGFKTAKDGANLTPSTSFAVFATLDGRRRIEIKFTDGGVLDEISNYTTLNYGTAMRTTIDNWDNSISNATREERYMLTGNILQAWSDASAGGILPGRLVSYTDIDGNIKDGILMNNTWETGQLRSAGKPISDAIDQIRDLPWRDELESTDGQVSIARDYVFRLRVPKSKKDGAKYFQDARLLSLVGSHNFYQSRGRFEAEFTHENLPAVLQRLSELGVRVADESAENSWEEIDQPQANNDDIRFREDPTAARVRQKEDPKKTIKVYKLMRLGDDGKLYPLFIDSSAGISIGEWYDAESPDLDFLKKIPSGVFLVNPADGSYTSLEDYANEHGFKAGKFPPKDAINEASVNGMRWVKITDTEKGQRRYEGENRKYENIGINGSGSVSTFAMRPGWHAGSLPTMRQIGKGPQRNLRDDSFVWVEGEVPADVDYNAEAQSNPDNDIPTHIPTDGYYMKSTNANAKAAQADKVGWYVAGSFKANRIISDAEARAVIDEYNAAHPEQEPVEYDYARESGREFTPEERRISAAEREVTNATLDRMSEELGIKINRVGRDQMPNGHKSDKGYYNPSTGEMTICMDNARDERDAIATVLHETVGHHGLRRLFGDRFNDAMARIYAALDQKGRTWVNGYIARHPNADNTRAVEEYLSHLAESGNFKNTVWDNIKRIIGRIVDALFGTKGFLLTDNELNYILRASYENLKNPNWLNTVEGRAFDTLLKRQLGINETDPNKPTDPDGPGAGNLYRDGDTGVANDDYNREMDRQWNKALTENQDSDRPVRIGMDKVMKEKGIKSISEDEDYLVRHNIASSRAESEAHEFELSRFNPLLEQVRSIRDRLIGRKATDAERQNAYERVLDYMYAVSGLERNAYKNDEIEQEKQAKLADAAAAGITDPAKFAEIAKKYDDMKRDWSGITSLMGMSKDNWQAAEAAAQAMIDAFKRDVGDNAVLDELWNRVRACTDFSLEHAYQHGLLTREEFERLHGTASQPRMWDYYLPLRGFSEPTAEEQFSYENFTNPSRNSVVVKKMNGRWTQADNPLANILNIAETEIVQGNDNWAKQALYRFALNAGENSLLTASEPWYVKNPATGKWSLAFPDPGESLEEFEARMKALRALDDPLAKKGRRGLKLENIVANKAHRDEHAIHLKVGGIDKMIWVNGDPALAKAVSGIGRAQNLQWIRRASRTLSNLFTTYSLDFTAKNLIRDTIYSRVALLVKEDKAYRHQFRKNWYANLGYGAFAYPMVRLASEWENGTLMQKEKAGTLTKREQDFLNFMRDGGQTGYTIVNSVSQIKKDIERSMRRSGDKPGTVPILGWYANAVKTLNEGFELLTRFTAYQTSRDMGRSGQRAASDAKEISVNFNRRGAQSGKGIWGNIAAYLGATHYFYNAGVQGFDNFLKLYKKAPVKITAATASLLVMGMLTPFINSMLAGLVGGGDGDDDWYWNLPEWVRRNNIVIGTGKWYLAIPLPVEFRAPYGIGDIAGSAFAYDKYPNRDFGDVVGDIFATASSILPVNPVEGYTSNGNIGDAIIRTVAPDAGMFFVDWATNRDYTGRPLWKENPFSDTVPKSQGAYASTPKGIVVACQKIAEVTNGGIDIAPGLVRDAMNNYLGGFFRAAEDVSKEVYGLFGNDPERPFRWDNVPFFSGFTGHIDEDRSNSFAQNAIYDYKKLSEDNVKSMNAILNTDDVTSAVLYDEPESLYEREGVTIVQKAKIKRMLDSKNYALGKMYREGMNNKYKMKQSLKDGHWYKSREVERKGVNALRQEWKDLRDQWAKMPDKTEEQKSAKAEMDLKVQEAWHLYYDAMGDLAEKLMDYEYNK